jgi:hypothetical protein
MTTPHVRTLLSLLVIFSVGCPSSHHSQHIAASDGFSVADVNRDGVDDVVGVGPNGFVVVDGKTMKPKAIAPRTDEKWSVAGDRFLLIGTLLPNFGVSAVDIVTGKTVATTTIGDRVSEFALQGDNTVVIAIDNTAIVFNPQTVAFAKLDSPPKPIAASRPLFCGDGCESDENSGSAAMMRQGELRVTAKVKQPGTPQLLVTCEKAGQTIVVDPAGYGVHDLQLRNGRIHFVSVGEVKAVDGSSCRELWRVGDMKGPNNDAYRPKEVKVVGSRAYVTVEKLVGRSSNRLIVILNANDGRVVGWA